MKINTTPISSKHKYLQRLVNIDKNPKLLYYFGTIPDNNIFTVAVVGTRKPTPYGIEITQRIVRDLSKRGIAIVSGLAIGIDSIAHKTALENDAITIAVQGNGLDNIYPRSNYRLAQQIIDKNGLILSEYEPGVPPLGFRFLERNRLIAGLADAIIVIEAAIRSGTLNTAKHGLDQGKDVFAVPGNITSVMSAGCNRLINEGALVYTDIDDFLDRYPKIKKDNKKIELKGDDQNQDRIINLLKNGSMDGEAIIDILKCTASDFAVALTMLEVNNIIYQVSPNRWALK